VALLGVGERVPRCGAGRSIKFHYEITRFEPLRAWGFRVLEDPFSFRQKHRSRNELCYPIDFSGKHWRSEAGPEVRGREVDRLLRCRGVFDEADLLAPAVYRAAQISRKPFARTWLARTSAKRAGQQPWSLRWLCRAFRAAFAAWRAPLVASFHLALVISRIPAPASAILAAASK
jgi:hypothetical protein